MKLSGYQFLAASSAICLAVLAVAATRPHYGGTLSVEMRAKVSSLDPAEWPEVVEANTIVKLRELIYDRLVRLDQNGQPQPALAAAWEHDAQNRTWRFKLRPGVKWQDGSPLTPQDVLASLSGILPGGAFHVTPALAGIAPGWTLNLTPAGEIEIIMREPRPDLLITLATDPEWTIRRPAIPSPGALPVGTGPFRLTVWEAGRHAVLESNEDYWGGRPFIDRIEVQMGRPSRDQLLDLELGKADLVELDPGEARRGQQEGKKLWSSAPVELLSLHFDLNKPAVQDRRLREAVADSIDRAAIQKVLLQNYGEATGSIFPKWESGYAFLFPTAMDLGRARQLTAEIGTPPTLKLGYDANDALARQTAERIAVNARDVGITMQVSPLPQGWRRMPDAGFDLRVERTRIDGPTLDAAFRQAAFGLRLPANGGEETPEHVYGVERKFLDDLNTIPLAYAPELLGLGSRVKDWSALPWGAWHLEDAWLEAEKP
jgi:peptide/nickel transport system substrate-binding protein